MFAKLKTKTKTGFSLIELIVVIAIISLMSGALFVVNSKNNSMREVENVSQLIGSQLRTLQNDALTGKRIEWPEGSGTFVSVCRFTFDSTALDSYSIIYDKNCSGAVSQVGDILKVDVKSKKVKLTPVKIEYLSPRGETGIAQQLIATSTVNVGIRKFIRINTAGNTAISDN